MGFEALVPLSDLKDLTVDGNLHRWLRHFDHRFYREHAHAEGRADLDHLSDEELVLHFIRRGASDRRPYNRFFYSFIDPAFYRAQYPEMRFATDCEAIQHWMYHGVYERRIPNWPTRNLIDADIHMFQMGKVGSTSIETAMRKAGYRKQIPHLHWSDDLILIYPDCFYSYEELVNMNPDKRLVFVSGVRDPLERVVSGLFQSTGERSSSLQISDLVSRLGGSAESIRGFIAPHLRLILDWFSHGYYRGIDVFSHPFDPGRGYSVIREGNVTVFLYRVDALQRCWQPLSEVLGLNLEPTLANESRDKDYAGHYLEALARLKRDAYLQQEVGKSNYWRLFFEGQPQRRPASAFIKYAEGTLPGTALRAWRHANVRTLAGDLRDVFRYHSFRLLEDLKREIRRRPLMHSTLWSAVKLARALRQRLWPGAD